MDALNPHLHAVGVRAVERRIGKPARFFANLRARGTMKVRDLFATCYVLELDPVELMREVVEEREALNIRPPRIVGRAWKRVDIDGPGVGAERLAELDAALQTRPRQTRIALGRELSQAKREELPRLLTLYGACYRVESDLERARVVLDHAREMARKLRRPATESGVLIHQAYVSLERGRPHEALRRAEKAAAVSTRINDREGEGIALLAISMFRYYGKEYEECLDNLKAVLERPVKPQFRFSAHQCGALCWIALDQKIEARREIEHARELTPKVAPWLQGKLEWVEARLASGTERLAHLTAARNALCPKRPADCALVTVEVIEEALELGLEELAEQEAMRLCTLTEKTGSPRVERAILQLIHNRTRLTPKLVTRIRETVDAAQARRLSRLIRSDA
jgi:tetratricopeptide (TPR) repeat protein